jgi:hypothetical protein
VVGRLKDEISSSTSIYTQKYTPWAYIFEPLLNLLQMATYFALAGEAR